MIHYFEENVCGLFYVDSYGEKYSVSIYLLKSRRAITD